VSLSVVVGPSLELGLDGGVETQENGATSRTDRLRRLGVRAAWQPATWLSLTGSLARTLGADNQDQGETDGLDSEAQAAVAVPLGWLGLGGGARASVFARYANRRQQVIDHLFGLNEDRRAWSVNTGINVSLL
jgi:hypothetical protein